MCINTAVDNVKIIYIQAQGFCWAFPKLPESIKHTKSPVHKIQVTYKMYKLKGTCLLVRSVACIFYQSCQN